MPTGYTAGIVEGKDTFEEFVWRCTRAFGVMLHMRDDSLSERFTVPNHPAGLGENPHKEWLVECEKELSEFMELPRYKQAEAVRIRLEELIRSHKKSLERFNKENNKINAAIANINATDSPSDDHKEFIEFIKNQLDISLNDTKYLDDSIRCCQDSLNSIPSAINDRIRMLRDQVDRAKRSVEEWDRKNEGRSTAREWLRSLNKFIPCPSHMATPEFLEWIR